jgi:multiple sugar transport system substrate-binding protein
MADTPIPTGGVVMADMPKSESFVVPPPGQAPVQQPPTPPQNPFIPQGVTPEPVTPQETVVIDAQPPPGNSILKKLPLIGAFLVLILLLVFGGKFVYGLVVGSQPVTITYWGLWENDATVKSVLTDFEAKNPKIKVTYVKQSHRQYRERLQSAIARGEGPDVFRFHNTWVPMLRNELSPAPKTFMTATEFASTYYPVASADLVGGQLIYGVPLMIDGLGLYYNEDLLATAGVTPPTTWEDVLNMVPKLTVRNGNDIITSAIALGTTGNIENFSDILATMMMQNGAKLTNPTTKEAEEALFFYRKFSNPSDSVYSWNETLDNSVYAFASGKVAMILAPSWRAFDIKQISPELRFKIIPIPQLPGNTVTWASYWVEGVSTKSKYKEQAWAFINYLASKEVVTKLYSEAAKTRLFGEPYARVDLSSAISQDPLAGAFVTQAPNAKSFPLAARTFDNGINDKMIKYLEDAVNGLNQGSAPAAVLQTVANGFRQVLGSYGLTSSAPITTP